MNTQPEGKHTNSSAGALNQNLKRKKRRKKSKEGCMHSYDKFQPWEITREVPGPSNQLSTFEYCGRQKLEHYHGTYYDAILDTGILENSTCYINFKAFLQKTNSRLDRNATYCSCQQCNWRLSASCLMFNNNFWAFIQLNGHHGVDELPFLLNSLPHTLIPLWSC